MARTAAATSSTIRDPRKRSGSRRPRTRWQSVTVGSSPPKPKHAGPGRAPALLGPTRRAPSSSIQATDPPPAPIEVTSMVGARTGRPAISVSVRSWTRPFSMIATSNVVPPTSVQIASRCPSRRASDATPTTPPAGPDESVRTGRSTARSRVITPPFDCITPIGASIPVSVSRRRSASREATNGGCT